MTDYAVMFAV